ncbi:MAG TPA: hypothetical protein VGM94_01990, partial [Galbitalea sp.]
MARRSIATTAPVGALAIVAVLVSCVLLAGCAQHGAKASSPASSSPSATKSPSTPTPQPTPTFAAKTYTCESILPPATLAVFKQKQSAGFTLQKDYVERVHNFSPDLAQFSDWGGILCQWAYPDAQNSVDYGFSP